MATTPGTHTQVEILGRNLKGTYGLWIGTDGIQAEILTVEPAQYRLKEGKKIEDVAGDRVRLKFKVRPEVKSGPHAFRLLAQNGISNRAIFWVNLDPVILETDSKHQSPETAQSVPSPAAINGRIGHEGEQDHYTFEISETQILSFEVVECVQRSSGDFIRNPGFRMELYGPQESWFDPERIIKLGQTNTWVSNFNQFKYAADIQPRLTRNLAKGVYQARVSGEVGSAYQLQIGPPDHFHHLTRQQGFDKLWKPSWLERDFTRRLKSDRLRSLRNRSGSAAASRDHDVATELLIASPNEDPVVSWREAASISEQEPNDHSHEAKQIGIPTIVRGAIQSSGDVDYFSFLAEQNQRLAFELETPQATFPYFNPRLTILDTEGRELFTNIYKRQFAQDMFYWTTTEAKTLFTFPEEGVYLLQIRDVTQRKGAADFSYRLMVRPQIPHVGEVEVAETVSILPREGNVEIDRINLAPGEVKKLTIFTAREESLEEDILVAVENLPEGVAAYPGTEADIYPEPPQDQGPKERFMPIVHSTILLITAETDAPATTAPQFIRFVVRPVQPSRVSRYYKLSAEKELTPIRQGLMGPSLPVLEIPLMVVAPLATKNDGTRVASANSY